MDVLSLLGIVVGIAAILAGNSAEGGSASALINGPAALIVLGGTCGAGLLQTPLPHLRSALKMALWIFVPPQYDFEKEKKKILNWAAIARREGLLGLENLSDTEKNAFAQRGLQMMVDGSEPQSIRNAMETDAYLQEQRELGGAYFFEAMGGYAPTIGIIGAVLGLIQVMTHLADPAELGSGIAVAFVATIYGVALANLLLLPMANKLRSIVAERTALCEMQIEGIVSIADGEHPRSIQLKLAGFFG